MRSVLAAFVLFTGLATGCQDYLFGPVCPQSVEESQITSAPLQPTPADILFVVDNSGSMADDQRRLADSFDAFINQLSSVQGADYQIAVVTTDLSSAVGEESGEVSYKWQTSAPYEVDLSRYDETACRDAGIAHGCFRGPDAAARVITSAQSKLDQDRLFTDNVTVGSCGSGTEEGLAAAIRALENIGTNACNRSFLREGANLVVIFVTDEQDGSPGAVAQYANDLGRFKPWKEIRAAAIIGSVDGDARGCRAVGGLPSAACGSQCDACPGASWCGTQDDTLFAGDGCSFCSYYDAPDCCSALAGSRYEEFLSDVDARVKAADPGISTATLVDSICQDDFSTTLRRIASEIIFEPCYPLSGTPVNPAGIAVRVVGGRELAAGTDFEVRSAPNQVDQVCLTGAMLAPGESLEIAFVTSVERRPSRNPACN